MLVMLELQLFQYLISAKKSIKKKQIEQYEK